jgi:Holliday junction resolvasome RuvABC endonuclease subunit
MQNTIARESFKEIDIEVNVNIKKVWLGIDNGKRGGLVVIDERNNVVDKIVMPVQGGKGENYDLAAIFKFIEKYQPVCVAIEKSLIAGGLTSKTTARMVGYSQGIAEMACVAAGMPYVVIAPKEWQKWCFAGLPQDDTKVASVMFAKRSQPNEVWRANDRCINNHDGLTDAYCLAVYCRNKFYK